MSSRIVLRGCGWLVGIGLVVLAAGGAARAAEDPEALIRQGVTLRKSGDDAKAQGYFQRAYDIARTPRLAAQLGLVEYALSQFGPAEIHLAEALLAAASDVWVQTNADTLRTSLAEVRTHLGRLRIDGSPPGARVRAGGADWGTLPLSDAIHAPAGPLQVEVDAPGFESARQTVTLVVGEEKRVAINLRPGARSGETGGALPDATAGTPAQAGGPVGWRRPAAWAAAGVAAALVVGGTLAMLASNSNYDKFNNEVVPEMPAQHRCNKAAVNAGGGDCPELLSAGDRDKTLAILGFAGAGAFAAASAVLFVTSAAARGPGEGQALSCAPTVQTAVGATCLVRF